ncbi:hypothetical protein RB653_007086 [Dictyostelium firmibasis]|uniref:Transmembrane protein n=1 Tax=Dictyostelium firmibasis TaxID=79012 RepID=A0AAN7TU13_9MYCE
MIESCEESSSSIASSNNQNDKTSLLNHQKNNPLNNQSYQSLFIKPTKEIVIVERGHDGKFSIIIPKILESVFTIQEYTYLVNRINNYRTPSQSFYILMMIFQVLLFLITVSLSFYFLIVGNKLYGLGFFLLFLSILSLIGITATYFKKTNDYIEEVQEFYKKLSSNYEIKSVRFYGKFKKIGCESFYSIVNSHLLIEIPKSLDQNSPVLNQKVPLYSLYNYGTFDQKFYDINNNISNTIPLNNSLPTQTTEKENKK